MTNDHPKTTRADAWPPRNLIELAAARWRRDPSPRRPARAVIRTLKRAVRRTLDSGAAVAVDAEACVRYAGHVLPPPSLRRCTAAFKDDGFFLASARFEVARLVEHCGLSRSSRVLDVGCGAGRLALGLRDAFGSVRGYVGVDVDRWAIDWCRRWIETDHPAFRFAHVDVANDRYNPGGTIRLDDRFRFDLPGGHFDVIHLYAVLSHMTAAEVRVYLREVRRLLAPDGAVFLTAYVEDGVPRESINPDGYRRATRSPLHRVRLSRHFFHQLVADAGLVVHGVNVHGEHDGQTGVYLRRASAAPERTAA